MRGEPFVLAIQRGHHSFFGDHALRKDAARDFIWRIAEPYRAAEHAGLTG
jgi:hypothetical protein